MPTPEDLLAGLAEHPPAHPRPPAEVSARARRRRHQRQRVRLSGVAGLVALAVLTAVVVVSAPHDDSQRVRTSEPSTASTAGTTSTSSTSSTSSTTGTTGTTSTSGTTSTTSTVSTTAPTTTSAPASTTSTLPVTAPAGKGLRLAPPDGLENGSTVRLVFDPALPPDQWVAVLLQCASEVLGLPNPVGEDALAWCRIAQSAMELPQPVDLTVSRFVDTKAGPVDCAQPGRCVVVTEPLGDVRDVRWAPLVFRADLGPAPTPHGP